MNLSAVVDRLLRGLVLLSLATAVSAVTHGQTVPKARISFGADSYAVNESDGFAALQLVRTGDTNEAVSVTFAANGPAPLHFVPTTNVVEFAAGETNRTVLVTLVDDEVKGPEFEAVSLTLLQPSANAVIARGSAYLIVRDDDSITVGFGPIKTPVWETNGFVEVKLFRTGGLPKEVRVIAAVTAANQFTALGLFTPLTNEVVFPPGITSAGFLLPTVRDLQARGNDTATLRLYATIPNLRLAPSSASLTFQEADVELIFGTSLSAPENAGSAMIEVVRLGQSSFPVAVDLLAQDDSAQAGVDYELPPTRLEFPAGVITNRVSVKLIDDHRRQGPRSFRLRLANPVGAILPLDRATFTISDDEMNSGPGAAMAEPPEGGFDNFVTSLVALPEDRLLVSGWFQNYRGQPARNVIILQRDGSRDPSFESAGVTSGFVDYAVPLASGRILVTGFFSQFAGQPRTNAVILEANGTVVADRLLNFDTRPGPVRALPDGGVLVAGASLGQLNGQSIPRVIRLNPDGQLDETFAGGTNCLSSPSSILPLSEGAILSDGSWQGARGEATSPVRLLAKGNLDPAFDAVRSIYFAGGFSPLPDGSYASGNGLRFSSDGQSDSEYGDGKSGLIHLTLPDGRMIVSRPMSGGTELLRLLADGTPDGEFRAWLNGGVNGVTMAVDGTLTVAGYFSSVNNEPHAGIVRLRADDSETPARIRWHGAKFAAWRKRGIAQVPLLRRGEAVSAQTVHFRTREGTAMVGQDYWAAEGDLAFAPGERVKLVEVSLVQKDGPELDKEFGLELTGAETDSEHALAQVIVLGNQATIEFATDGQEVGESSWNLMVEVRRTGALGLDATVDVAFGGTATPVLPDYSNYGQADYFEPATTRITFAPGQTNAWLYPSLYDDASVEGPETIELTLTHTGEGVVLGPRRQHTVTVVDDDTADVAGENYLNAPLFSRADGGLWLSGWVLTPTGRRPSPNALRNDGSLDPNLITPVAWGSLILDRFVNGRLWMGRYHEQANAVEFYRLSADGQPDPSFPVQSLPTSSSVRPGEGPMISGATTPDGGAVGAIAEDKSPPEKLLLRLARFDSNGQPVADFVGPQVLRADRLRSPALAVASDGKILIAGPITAATPPSSGSIFSGTIRRSNLVRLLPHGSLDPSLRVEFASDQFVWLRGLSLLADDRMLVVGRFDAVNGQARPGIVRLYPDGTVDESFMPTLVISPNGPTTVARAASGKVLTTEPQGAGYRVVRLNSDGSRDAAFIAPEFDAEIRHLLELPDGRVVVSGSFERVDEALRGGYAWLGSDGALLPARPLVLHPPLPEDGGNRLRIDARFSGSANLERSADLEQWFSIRSIPLVPGLNEVLVSPPLSSAEFFRLK